MGVGIGIQGKKGQSPQEAARLIFDMEKQLPPDQRYDERSVNYLLFASALVPGGTEDEIIKYVNAGLLEYLRLLKEDK